MDEEKVLTFEFDKERMRKEQRFQLILSFAVFAFLFTLGLILMYTVHMMFSLICFYGLIYFIWWPLVLVVYLCTKRRPVGKMEIDFEKGTVKINEDAYRLYEDRVYITVDSGIARFLHYAVLTLNITNEDGKRVASYFMGPVSGAYSKRSRGKINDILPLLSAMIQMKGTYDKVLKEKEETVGTVKIEFPAGSIKKTFYATGIPILGIADFAFLFSFLPQSVYGNDNILTGALALMRFLSLVLIVIGLCMCAMFFYRYSRLAKTIEISWNMIKINGREFLFSDIRRIGMIGAVEDPENQGEAQSWLLIDHKGKIHKFYLGQVKNKKCFEPRRRLKLALGEFFKS